MVIFVCAVFALTFRACKACPKQFFILMLSHYTHKRRVGWGVKETVLYVSCHLRSKSLLYSIIGVRRVASSDRICPSETICAQLIESSCWRTVIEQSFNQHIPYDCKLVRFYYHTMTLTGKRQPVCLKMNYLAHGMGNTYYKTRTYNMSRTKL